MYLDITWLFLPIDKGFVDSCMVCSVLTMIRYPHLATRGQTTKLIMYRNKLRHRMKLLEFRRLMKKNKLYLQCILEYDHTCFWNLCKMKSWDRNHQKLLSLERFEQAESGFWFISLTLLLHQKRHQEGPQNFIWAAVTLTRVGGSSSLPGTPAPGEKKRSHFPLRIYKQSRNIHRKSY